jgi:hypothetical protein
LPERFAFDVSFNQQSEFSRSAFSACISSDSHPHDVETGVDHEDFAADGAPG